MATAAEIQRLRMMVGDPTEEEFSDFKLNLILDAQAGNFNRAASEAWGMLAAGYTTLVNVSESGSTRNLGDLYKNAMTMKKYFDDAGVEGVSRGRTRIGRISRADD